VADDNTRPLKAAGTFSFLCSSCHEVHEGSPSVAYRFPDHYAQLTDEERKTIGKAQSDFCQVHDDYFIRTLLEIPIFGAHEPFVWGVWMSVSKENFFRYWDSFDDPTEVHTYSGRLCNQLPGYPNTLQLKVVATTRLDGNRPDLTLEQGDHPLAIDFHSGMSKQRAQEIGEITLHAAASY
jgi:hypothetical protein